MSYISIFDSEASGPLDDLLADSLNAQLAGVTTWRVEIMDANGNWVPEPDRWLRPAPLYNSYELAVEGAVRTWRRLDLPARPARLLQLD